MHHDGTYSIEWELYVDARAVFDAVVADTVDESDRSLAAAVYHIRPTMKNKIICSRQFHNFVNFVSSLTMLVE